MGSDVRFHQSVAFLPTRQIMPMALLSEELGYGGIYVSDHVFNPRSRESRYTYSKREDGHPGWEDETAWPDPMCVISALASLTEQLVFTTGLGLILSALTVHFRDIRDLLSNMLMLWFFATPIIYSWRQENVQRYKFLFDLNPLTHIAISYQEILFFGPVGHWRWLLALGAASLALFVAGYWLFDRLRDSFAEAV